MSGQSLLFWRAKSRYLSDPTRDFACTVQVSPEYKKNLDKLLEGRST